MTATFNSFEMERLMSKWENVVEYNLSESGVHPMTLSELVQGQDDIERLLATEINYPQANGIPKLRENISALYPDATPEHILVTVGCIEANFIALETLLHPGDEIAVMLPNYMQIWGLAKNKGLGLNTFTLREDQGWKLDNDFNDAVTENTKMIAICNPNNPTGSILTEEEMDIIVAAAERVGAWILADEVYAGAERTQEEQTSTFWGRYDKVLAMGSLSKAYGLPGLRIGWVVGPPAVLDDMWARHEYLTISCTMLGNHLAEYALRPDVRPRLIQRARNYIRKGYPVLDDWMKNHGETFSVVPPQAAAIAFVRYHLNINSSLLIDKLMREKSVLIIPGDHFGFDSHFRISFGLPPEFLKAGLDRIHELIAEL